jgi:hypothetical protein
VAVSVPLLMRADLPTVQRRLEPRRVRTADPAAEPGLVAQYGRWVDGIIRRGGPLVRPGCLTRGVTAYYGLRRCGVGVALCFGVGTVGGTMEGHCWLEVAERAVLEPGDPRTVFTEVARMSALGVTEGGRAPDRMAEWAPPTP